MAGFELKMSPIAKPIGRG